MKHIILKDFLSLSPVPPQHKQEEADRVKQKFAGDSESDHIALFRAFEGWERSKNPRQYCWENFLSHNTLEVMKPRVLTILL